MANNNKPVHEIRMGRIVASIWANASQKGNFYAVTVSRLYRKEPGWARSTSFGRDDLPLVGKVLSQAYIWLYAAASTNLVAKTAAANANGEAAPAPAASEDSPFDEMPF